MKILTKKIKIKDIYLILTIVLGLVTISLYSTYALFTSEEITTNTAVNMSVGFSYGYATNEVEFITLNAKESKEISVSISNTSSSSINYNLYYELVSGDEASLEAGYTSNTENPTNGVLDASSSKTVMLGFINNSDSDIIVKVGFTPDSIVSPRKELNNEVTIITTTFASILSDKYNSNKSTTPVVNNSVNYYYAPSESLMQDKAGNIRYYGANPNNYIYFNCDDYSNQTVDACEVWRIIGVFDGKIKLIRNSVIGSYSWDTSASTVNSGQGYNQWGENGDYKGADLMKLLNPGYSDNTDLNSRGTSIKVNNSLYYDGQSGTCYNGQSNNTTTCNFTGNGIVQKNAKTEKIISKTTYYFGGIPSYFNYSNDAYSSERNTNNTWEGYVALPYVSDYGYAADFNNCTSELGGYSKCYGYNWLSQLFASDGYNSWLLSYYSGNSKPMYGFLVKGSSGGNVDYLGVMEAYKIFPTIHLNPEIGIDEATTGSSTDPYKLIVK